MPRKHVPLVQRALRRHVLSGTRPQLALHSCERFPSTSSSYGLLDNSLRTSSLRRAPLYSLSLSPRLHTTLRTLALSERSATCLSPSFRRTELSHTCASRACAPHSDLQPSRPALFWARSISVRQSHGLTALPPCLSSLRNQAEEEDAVLPLRDSRGRFGGTSRCAPENQAGTEPQQQRSAPALWRETSPRLHPSLGECHHTVLV